MKAKIERYIAAARVALDKRNWRQLVFICEQIIKLEEAVEGNDDKNN